MTLSRSLVTGFGLVGLSSVLVLAACSSDEGDGGTPGAGAPGTTAGSPGTAGTNTVGGSPGGAGGPASSGAGGTGTGTAGAPTAGTTATGGTSTGTGGGSGTDGPFACAATPATCGSISDFPVTTAQGFGKGTFGGGYSVFGAGLTRDAAETGAIHVTGKVAAYGHGFNIWFNTCSSLTGTTGISFKISGMAGTAGIRFEPQTNSNYPWTATPEGKKGGCNPTTVAMQWDECVPGSKAAIPVTATPTVIEVPWADIMGGMPMPFDATTGPGELVGLQWQFPWAGPTDTEYAVDVTIDDITFMGATAAEACPATGTAAGGAGGGGGGGAAGAPAAGAPSGGSPSAGSGGASGGAAGSASGGSAGVGGAAGGSVSGGAAGSAGVAGGS